MSGEIGRALLVAGAASAEGARLSAQAVDDGERVRRTAPPLGQPVGALQLGEQRPVASDEAAQVIAAAHRSSIRRRTPGSEAAALSGAIYLFAPRTGALLAVEQLHAATPSDLRNTLVRLVTTHR
jgi:hypothetical protein